MEANQEITMAQAMGLALDRILKIEATLNELIAKLEKDEQ
jgi:hypothetical protein